MDTNDTLSRLNSLTVQGLGLPEDDADIDEILSDAFGKLPGNSTEIDRAAHQSIIIGIEYLKKTSKRSANKDLIQRYAWRCTHIFEPGKLFPEPRVCNTINATYSKNPTIRKRCQKCQHDRTNPLTVIQELRNYLIKELIKQGFDPDMAIAKVDEVGFDGGI